MLFALLPYALQLLCVIHIIKTRQNSSWLWIVVFVPYVGGIAYLLIEILPSMTNGNKMESVKDSIGDMIKPDRKFEIIRQKALYSSTFKNMVEYADALAELGRYSEALEIYTQQNSGAFANDPELMYRIASVLFHQGDHDAALSAVSDLIKSNKNFEKRSRENLLYLRIIEQVKDKDFVKSEYQRVMRQIQNNTIELPYIEYLSRNDDWSEMETLFEKIHSDEQSMKINRIRYDRRFYKAVYQLEKNERRKRPPAGSA